MLAVENLECIRGDRVLFSNVGFSLQRGELLHVRGSNGSGKTSLLRILCGLMSPAQGHVRWNGMPITELGDEYYRSVLYIGHLSGLKDEFSAVENLRVSTDLAGARPDLAQIQAALKRMGLADYDDLPAKVLSQGQRRRIALARLFLSDAQLWILDEPLAALDAAAVTLIEEAILAHLGRGGLAVVTTHQPLAVQCELRALHLGIGIAA